MLAVRRRWLPRFLWFAAIVAPLSVGLLVYWTARPKLPWAGGERTLLLTCADIQPLVAPVGIPI
jgi:hypothetical protein